MVITYHGTNCFRVTSGEFTLLTDPAGNRMKPNLTLKTISNPASFDEDFKVLDAPGEFDIDGVFIKGFQVASESTADFLKIVFSIQGLDDLSLAFLGHLSETLESNLIERLGHVDLLFLPVGDKPYLSVESAAKLVKQIDPKIVIPALHGDKKLADLVIKELGREGEYLPKLTVKSKDLPEKGPRVVILKDE